MMVNIFTALFCVVVGGFAAYGVIVLIRATKEENLRRRLMKDLQIESDKRLATIRTTSKLPPISVESFLNEPIDLPADPDTKPSKFD